MRLRNPLPACVLVAVAAAGCSKSSTSPSDAAPDRILEGVAVSAVDGAPAAGLSVQVGSARAVTTDAAGRFTAEISSPGDYTAVVSGSAIVERRTKVTGPTSVPARLSLMPASFDVHAFDEMFRTANARLQRWTTRPALVVLGTVMNFRGDADEFIATSEQMTDEEVSLLIAHLNEGPGAADRRDLYVVCRSDRRASSIGRTDLRRASRRDRRRPLQRDHDLRADDRLRALGG